MRPDLIDSDLAPAIERSSDSTSQVAILEATLPSPPAPAKPLDKVIAVRTNDQIAQSTFQQLNECPNFHSV